MIGNGQLPEKNIPPYKQFMALARIALSANRCGLSPLNSCDRTQINEYFAIMPNTYYATS
jgi:hypothetical protein